MRILQLTNPLLLILYVIHRPRVSFCGSNDLFQCLFHLNVMSINLIFESSSLQTFFKTLNISKTDQVYKMTLINTHIQVFNSKILQPHYFMYLKKMSSSILICSQKIRDIFSLHPTYNQLRPNIGMVEGGRNIWEC